MTVTLIETVARLASEVSDMASTSAEALRALANEDGDGVRTALERFAELAEEAATRTAELAAGIERADEPMIDHDPSWARGVDTFDIM